MSARIGATRTTSAARAADSSKAAGHDARLEAIGRLAARLPFGGFAADDLTLAGMRFVGAVMGAILLGSSTEGWRALFALPLGCWVGSLIGRSLHERAGRAESAAAAAALPDALDRLTTCVLAGMSIERALRIVVPSTPEPLGAALREGLHSLDAGVPRARAYERIARRARAEEVATLTAALARAERFGGSVSTTLTAYARDLRSRARAAAETDARTAPIKLIFPLTLCFLPAFVLLTIVPIALAALRTLGDI